MRPAPFFVLCALSCRLRLRRRTRARARSLEWSGRGHQLVPAAAAAARDAPHRGRRSAAPLATTNSNSSESRERTLKSGEENWLAASKHFSLHVDARGVVARRLPGESAVVPGSAGPSGNRRDPHEKQSARDPRSANWRRSIVAPARRAVARVRLHPSLRSMSAALNASCVISWRFLFSSFSSLPMHAENKFDFATTPGKLPKDVLPSQYAIRIVAESRQAHFHRLGNGQARGRKRR